MQIQRVQQTSFQARLQFRNEQQTATKKVTSLNKIYYCCKNTIKTCEIALFGIFFLPKIFSKLNKIKNSIKEIS